MMRSHKWQPEHYAGPGGGGQKQETVLLSHAAATLQHQDAKEETNSPGMAPVGGLTAQTDEFELEFECEEASAEPNTNTNMIDDFYNNTRIFARKLDRASPNTYSR